MPPSTFRPAVVPATCWIAHHPAARQRRKSEIKKLFIPAAAALLALVPVTAAAGAASASTAPITGPRTTIVYTPHPDDETLRLSGYVSYAAARGDKLILVAVTDGEATYLTHLWGWDTDMMKEFRVSEQEQAWAALTKGQGTIIRLHYPDGGVQAHEEGITSMAKQLNDQYGPDVENYVAADAADPHPDHRATVEAVQNAHPRILRTALERGNHNGILYASADLHATNLAAAAYKRIGWPSVPGSFDNLVQEESASYVH